MFWLFTRERYDIEMRMKQKLLGNVRYDPRLALRGDLVHFMEPQIAHQLFQTGLEGMRLLLDCDERLPFEAQAEAPVLFTALNLHCRGVGHGSMCVEDLLAYLTQTAEPPPVAVDKGKAAM
jgi:hypothetical protein